MNMIVSFSGNLRRGTRQVLSLRYPIKDYHKYSGEVGKLWRQLLGTKSSNHEGVSQSFKAAANKVLPLLSSLKWFETLPPCLPWFF